MNFNITYLEARIDCCDDSIEDKEESKIAEPRKPKYIVGLDCVDLIYLL